MREKLRKDPAGGAAAGGAAAGALRASRTARTVAERGAVPGATAGEVWQNEKMFSKTFFRSATEAARGGGRGRAVPPLRVRCAARRRRFET